MSTDATDQKLVKGCIAVLGVLLLVILGAFIIFQSRQAGPPLLFTIPKDFHGPFRIVKDANSTQQLQIDDQGIHITIPPNGEARYKDLSALEKNHRVKIVDSAGKSIPYSMGDPYD